LVAVCFCAMQKNRANLIPTVLFFFILESPKLAWKNIKNKLKNSLWFQCYFGVVLVVFYKRLGFSRGNFLVKSNADKKTDKRPG